MLKPLFHGATMLAFLASGLFFLRFWLQSRDRLFGFFALALLLLGLHSGMLTLVSADDEHRNVLYVVRLFSFLLILYAIWDKNRSARGPQP